MKKGTASPSNGSLTPYSLISRGRSQQTTVSETSATQRGMDRSHVRIESCP